VEEGGHLRSAYVTAFEDGLKIDFTLWPTGLLRQISAQQVLPPEFDAGYRVLLDKDKLAEGLPPPSYRGYIPAPPTAAEFREKLESFFLDALYVDKCLRRGELVAARHVQEFHMKQEHLVRVLEWLGQIEYGWVLKTGPHGRRIETWLRPDLLARLAATYTSLGVKESQKSFACTFDLFCEAALEVAGQLSFKYPLHMEQKIRGLLSDLAE
jgi:aminoglycoside 6-adenylyltransferase